MKRQCLIPLLLALAVSVAASAVDRPHPLASEERAIVPVHYADQAVVISTQEGVALVRFTEWSPKGVSTCTDS